MRTSTLTLLTIGLLTIGGSAIRDASLTRHKAHAEMPKRYVCPDRLLREPGKAASIVPARPPGKR